MDTPNPLDPPGRAAALAFSFSTAALLGAVGLAVQGVGPPGAPPDGGASAHLGYTRSLVLFLVPVAVLGVWLLRRPDLSLARKSFWWVVVPWALVGFGLDFLLASRLFRFENEAAVLPIPGVPVLGDGTGELFSSAPIEEFVFYASGFLAVLLTYIWADEVWLERYNVPDYEGPASQLSQILRFDGRSLVWGALLLAAGWIYKEQWSDHPGFPLYLAFLVACAFVPSAGLFRTTVEFVNWRAFGFTFFWIVLVSLVWEVTLGLPYRYWGYQEGAMVGLRVEAWHGLPIEAVLVWLAVTYSTVLVYEAVKIWQASGMSARQASFGPRDAS